MRGRPQPPSTRCTPRIAACHSPMPWQARCDHQRPRTGPAGCRTAHTCAASFASELIATCACPATRLGKYFGIRYVLAQAEPKIVPTMNSNTTKKSKSFKATYLRLLNGENPGPEDMWAVPELISAGLATGHPITDATSGVRRVTTVIDFAPTVQGRLMADELADSARKSTLRYRLLQLLLACSSFGAGWVFGVFNQVAANLLTKHLGG
jgi:hypothetical protein